MRKALCEKEWPFGALGITWRGSARRKKQRSLALCKVNVARGIRSPVGIRCLYVQELTHKGVGLSQLDRRDTGDRGCPERTEENRRGGSEKVCACEPARA